MNLDEQLRKIVSELRAPQYPKPRPDAVQLDANTNLFGLNPAVERVMRGEIPDVTLYPSPFSDDLRAALAAEHGVKEEQTIVGNGSDEIFDFICKTFLNPDEVLGLPVPSFVMHTYYGRINLAKVVSVPLADGFRLDPDALLKTKAKLTVIASPNNPTGNAFDPAAIDRVIRESEGLVLLDEAYANFCGQNYIARVGEFDNLIVVRTFSKAYGLAAVRVGYAVSNVDLIDRLHRVKPPFTVGVLPEAIAVEALREKAFVKSVIDGVASEKGRLATELGKLGLKPCPTDANFMMIDLGRDASPVAQALAEKKILVRDMTTFGGLKTHIRVTIGKTEHTDALIRGLKEVL